MTGAIPTERLDIVWPAGILPDTDDAAAYAYARILEKADELAAAGQRPWFEVRYPLPEPAPGDTRTEQERLAARELSFDALEVRDGGEITTVPPYAELMQEDGS